MVPWRDARLVGCGDDKYTKIILSYKHPRHNDKKRQHSQSIYTFLCFYRFNNTPKKEYNAHYEYKNE
jgi:hypothetical protein